MDELTFQRRLYMGRRQAEKANKVDDPSFYLPTLSPHTLSYKGLVTPENLPKFFLDLNDPRFESSLAVFHQRFSTNTWPQWKLAQPSASWRTTVKSTPCRATVTGRVPASASWPRRTSTWTPCALSCRPTVRTP
jgi:hypothetical protein